MAKLPIGLARDTAVRKINAEKNLGLSKYILPFNLAAAIVKHYNIDVKKLGVVSCEEGIIKTFISRKGFPAYAIKPTPKRQYKPRQKSPSTDRYAFVKSQEFLTSQEWCELRYKALKKCGAKCQCCGASPKGSEVVLHVDHIKPRCLFPELAADINNLQVLCEKCNVGKGCSDITDWRDKN